MIGWSEETPSPVVDDDDDDIKIRDVKAGSGLVFGLVGTRKRTVLCVCLSLFVIGQFEATLLLRNYRTQFPFGFPGFR